MNRRLLAAAEKASPGSLLLRPLRGRDRTADDQGREPAGGPTVNWFTDDHWRFDRFSRHFAPAFDWSVTTDRDSLPKYEAIGYDGVDPLAVGLQPLRLRLDGREDSSTT